jgi:hypothetical protein
MVRFANQGIRYLRCSDCRTVFVDPLPDTACFAQIYDKAKYYDSHYTSSDLKHYRRAAALLRQFTQVGSTVFERLWKTQDFRGRMGA